MITKWKSAVRALLGGFLALTMVSVSTPAHAAFVDGTLDQVEFGESGILLLSQAGFLYKSGPTPPGCSIATASADVRKTWVSLSQAALLAGKSVRIYFTTCNSEYWIRDIVLYK